MSANSIRCNHERIRSVKSATTTTPTIGSRQKHAQAIILCTKGYFKSSKGREKLQTYLKSRNSARSLHKSVIQAPSQLQKKTHTDTHTSEELFSHAHTHEAPRPNCEPRLYLNLLFFPSPSLSLTGLYSILGSNGWMWVIGSRKLDHTLTHHA